MKVESKEVVGDVVSEVVEKLKEYEKQLRDLAKANYPLTEIRVNLEESRVFVVWKDYSEEEKRIAELTTRALEIKEQLAEADEIKKAVLMSELGKINDEYKKLTGVEIYEVI